MTAIKTYLLRLILCGFLVALTGALVKGRRTARAVALCGGCLLILTALGPLLRVDVSRLPDLVTGLTRTEREAAARQKNDALLRAMVEAQTAEWIGERAAGLGLSLRAEVTATEAEAGTFVPWTVTLTGSWTKMQRENFVAVLEDELAIPPARQRWVGG